MSTELAQKQLAKKTTGSEHDAVFHDMGLLSYHEQQAGRLVVDPEYVLDRSSRSRQLLTQL